MTNLPKEFNMLASAWECPRCGRMNAPFNPSCFCKSDKLPEPDKQSDSFSQSMSETLEKIIDEERKKAAIAIGLMPNFYTQSKCDNCGGHHGIFQGRAVQCVNLGANGGA